jgi:hypothetical protein
LIKEGGLINYRQCASYIHIVQQSDWFMSAFRPYSAPVKVMGVKGRSSADALERRISIGAIDRRDLGKCEQACLHELAHIVTPDHGPDRVLREVALGPQSTKGHHHAWRVNFLLIVQKSLGRQAALRLRTEFNQWGLPTRR